jgi:hypothetical protein
VKSNFKLVCVTILSLFAGTAVMSVFLATIFRDVRRGPRGEYLTGYLWPRFMEFYMIFVPMIAIFSALLLVGWLIYELSRTKHW